MKKLKTINDLYVLLDNDTYEQVKHFTWRYSINEGYAITNIKKENGKWTTMTMHKFIYGKRIIPINGSYLDLRRKNILFREEFTNIIDSQRKKFIPKNKRSKYRGVTRYRNSKRWRSAISYKGEQIILGHFDNEVEAAKTFDKKAVELRGKDTFLNFPDDYK